MGIIFTGPQSLQERIEDIRKSMHSAVDALIGETLRVTCDAHKTQTKPKKGSVLASVLGLLEYENGSAAELLEMLLDADSTPDDRRRLYSGVYRALSTLTREGLVSATVSPLTGRKVYALVS